MSDGLSISGGSTGMDAAITDLKVFAGVLRDRGGDLLALAPSVAAAAIDDDVLASGLICPDVLPGVLAAIAAAELGPDGVVTRGAALGTVGTLLTAAAYSYEAADAAGAQLFNELQGALGFAAGMALPGLAVGAAAALLAAMATNPVLARQVAAYLKSGQMGPDLQQLLYEHPELTEALTRLAPGMVQGSLMSLSTLLGPTGPLLLSLLSGGNWPTTDYHSSLAGLLALGGLGGALQDTGDFGIDFGHPHRDNLAPGGVADIFAMQQSMNINAADGSDPYGQLRVIEVTGPDGKTRLIVQVPGTEDWSPTRGTNPVDTSTNVNAMSLRDTIMKQKVIEAIEQAQREHPGAEVMLTGHSQGGIVAATVASDPDVVKRLHITSLVTGGSPIARMPIDSSVSVLAVEHTQDPVPMLDGASNPDRSNWTTVRRDLPPEAVSSSGRPQVFDAHTTPNYQATGQLIDNSTDPAVADWRAKNAQFLTGTGSSTIYDIKPR